MYVFLWFVPPGIDDIQHSAFVKFIYYLVMYLAYQAILTVSVKVLSHQVNSSPLVHFSPIQCFHVPYSALTMHLSYHYKDRDSATLYRTLNSFVIVL